MKKIAILIFFLLGALQASSSDWISFGQGEEERYYGRLFIIEYPSDFTFSTKGRIFPIDYWGERLKPKSGDFLLLESRQREFSIKADPFVDHYNNNDGSPMNVEETLAFTKSGLRSPQVEYRNRYIVVHGITPDGLSYRAYFFRKEVPAEHGVDLQILDFTYSTPITQVDPVIMEILSRFKSYYEKPRFPLGKNDFVGWDEAVSEAMELDFYTPRRGDIVTMYGFPQKVVEGPVFGSLIYYYYCPDHLPKLQRLQQASPHGDRMRICLGFHFNEDGKLISVELTQLEIPEPEPS